MYNMMLWYMHTSCNGQIKLYDIPLPHTEINFYGEKI